MNGKTCVYSIMIQYLKKYTPVICGNERTNIMLWKVFAWFEHHGSWTPFVCNHRKSMNNILSICFLTLCVSLASFHKICMSLKIEVRSIHKIQWICWKPSKLNGFSHWTKWVAYFIHRAFNTDERSNHMGKSSCSITN